MEGREKSCDVCPYVSYIRFSWSHRCGGARKKGLVANEAPNLTGKLKAADLLVRFFQRLAQCCTGIPKRSKQLHSCRRENRTFGDNESCEFRHASTCRPSDNATNSTTTCKLKRDICGNETVPLYQITACRMVARCSTLKRCAQSNNLDRESEGGKLSVDTCHVRARTQLDGHRYLQSNHGFKTQNTVRQTFCLYRYCLIWFMFMTLTAFQHCFTQGQNITKRALGERLSPRGAKPGYFVQPLPIVDRKHLANASLFPSVVNLASWAEITANATCGMAGAVKYCKLVEHVDRRTRATREQCSICNAYSWNPAEHHPIRHAIDGRGDRWWQSPTIDQGYNYRWVTVTLDLKQVFQIAYVIVKAANSPRPGNWILEKSLDGKDWYPWQYFATSDRECAKVYNLPASSGVPKYRFDNEVTCTSYFSRLIPLENGEIHVSLIKGRPSAENPSPELVAFTSARHIRLRLQKIRTLHGDLMTLSASSPRNRDPSVTRRYYYSIKDISIGGMCICYGHARACPINPGTGLFQCACEHNTEGANCERCAPGYQQYKWMPGNEDFQCEACNCHGHSNRCFYDEDVDEKGASLNLRGEYSGGGVCIDCQHKTAGINCQTCIDGYYRPAEVEPDVPEPCVPCDCDAYGGVRKPLNVGSYVCVKDVTFIDPENNLYPGDCYCNEGFAGRRCDRCAFGFRGYPRCEPCTCNVAGSLNSDPCAGDCLCKLNVLGDNCGQCKEGYFNLQRHNSDGCEPCFCSGVTQHCTSADLKWDTVHTNHNWEVRDRRGRRHMKAQFDQDLREPYVEHDQVSRSLGTAMYYWAAPDQYLGERLSSYGGSLRYTVSYDILQGTEPLPIQTADVILQGKDKTLIYNHVGALMYPQEETTMVIKLKEGTNNRQEGWVSEDNLQPATKEALMAVLSNVVHLKIRAVYSRNAGVVYRIRDVYLQVASENGEGAPAESVEKCLCPVGYVGFSCENCAPGYWRRGKLCLPCACNSHSISCNPLNGACGNCQHNTMGMHCERCKPGFYGDATVGGANDCQMCSCPLPISSNNFSPTCHLDRANGEMVCLQCPTGYAGKRCEICAEGYFGKPTTPGGSCQPCQCNGNSLTCDRDTGVCTDCGLHTYGDQCEMCEPAYYGDATDRKNCGQCECDPRGSLNRECHTITGQCSCRRDVYGRKCDACASNYYLSTEERMCVPCACDSTGSLFSQCRANGSCVCREGVTGRYCDSCKRGYFGFSDLGCIECNCLHTNGNCDVETGECICPPNTRGYGCNQCVEGSFGLHEVHGCKLCNCSESGSVSSSCNSITGQCLCKPLFTGLQCDQCKPGYHAHPNCQSCNCDSSGTNASSCVGEGDGRVCQCSVSGQCDCKENVVGEKCDQCVPGSFGLADVNEAGCTSCYCSGVTNLCTQALLVWGPSVTADYALVWDVGHMDVSPTVSAYGKYSEVRTIEKQWKLPSQFKGDKLTSYGGFLRYSLHFLRKHPENGRTMLTTKVVLRGGRPGRSKVVEHEEVKWASNQTVSFAVPLKESSWQKPGATKKTTRSDISDILQNVEEFLIQVSYIKSGANLMLQDISLDVAQPGIFGRGDASTSFPRAFTIERCICPSGYTGMSCQNCANGFMRIQQGPKFGKCEACYCNNRSNVCDPLSGKCLNCQGKFTGWNCERCLPGYFLSGDQCKRCACPGNGLNNFSPTCYADGADGIRGYTCNACKAGYEGKHCERCADGYYGNLTIAGGFCRRCGCNVAGSLDGVCNKTTGQCTCGAGISGRVCDQCMPRHVITQRGCIKCDDECSGKLLDEMEVLINHTVTAELQNMLPPPWNKLDKYGIRAAELEERLNNDSIVIVNQLAVLNSLPSSARSSEAGISALHLRAQESTVRMDEMLQSVRETKEEANLRKKDILNLLKMVKARSRSVARLLYQLQNGSEEEIESMRENLEGWIESMRARSSRLYRSVAKKEQRKVAVHQRLTANVTSLQTNAAEMFNETYRKLLEDLSQKSQLFQSVAILLRNVSEVVNAAQNTNELNQQTLRQASSDIVRVRNEAVISNVTLAEARNLSKANGIRRENIRENMDISQGLSTTLLRLVDDLKSGFDSTMDRDLENLRNKEQMANELITKIQSDVNYIKGVQRNVSKSSYNQTEAATRWTKIAQRFDIANLSADMALASSQKAINTLTSDLSARSKGLLARSNTIHVETTSMQDFVTGDGDQLRDLNVALISADQSARNLAEQHEGIQTRLKTLKKRYSPSLADVKKTAEAVRRPMNALQKGLKKNERRALKLRKIQKDVQNRDNTIETVQKLLNRLNDTIQMRFSEEDRANRILSRVNVLSENMQANITKIRKLIEDSKRKAAAIRRRSVRSSGRCAMLYKPTLSSSKTTEVVLNVQTSEPNNLMFYLARKKKDYLAIELRQGRVVVSWDVGGGAASVENPVVVAGSESTSSPSRDNWFRIQVYRRNQDVNVTVYRLSDKAGTIQTRSGKAPGAFTVLDANYNDLLFVGGVLNTTEVPDRVISRTFTGCMGEAFLQGLSIGLWNFEQIQNPEDCTACEESPNEPEELETNLYSYTGHSYSVLPLRRKMLAGRSQFRLKLQTFSSIGLILYASSSSLPDFIALELLDGRLMLKLDTGEGVRNVMTQARYNFGDWVSVNVTRSGRRALLRVARIGQEQPETVWLPLAGSSDNVLNFTRGDYLCIGGAPGDRTIRPSVTRISFVGCLKDFVFENTPTPLQSSGLGEIVRDSGVTSTCPNEIKHNVGIAEGGFLKLRGFNLEPSGSVGITFNTLEPDAILLMGTSETFGLARRRRQAGKTFYAIYLSGGRVHVHLRLKRGAELHLVSPRNFYNDGSSHLVTVHRNGSNVALQMDEDIAIFSGSLGNNGDKTLRTRYLFVGGVPEDYVTRYTSIPLKSLNGCVRDLFADNLVNFKTAVEAKNTHVGTCDFVNFAPKTTVAPNTHVSNFDSGQLSPGSTTSSPFLSDDTMPRPVVSDDHCQSVGRLSKFQNSTAHFGLSTNSFQKFTIPKDVSKRFSFQVRIKTIARTGLLLYGGHEEHADFFSLKLKDGVPVFQFDNGKGVAEGVSRKAINDGKWHKVKLKRSRRRGRLIVDGKKTTFRSPKGAKHLDINNAMYVGGLPSYLDEPRIGKISNSMDVCIKDLTLNKRNKFDLSRPVLQSDVGRCYRNVESGAYFLGSGYVMQSDRYRVGTDLLIEFKFRTWAASGVFLTVQSSKYPDGLALEMINGSIYFRADNGAGTFEIMYQNPFLRKASATRRSKPRFPLCNGNWHTVRAEKRKVSLLLTVDGEDVPPVTSSFSTTATDTNDPLYVGGVPENAIPQTQLSFGAKNFRGCIKDMVVKGKPVLFNDVVERKGVYPESCPMKR